MPRQIQGSQRDFSFGQVDFALSRNDDHPARKAGLMQMVNARILNGGAVQNRSGRRALYPIQFGALRTERITMSSGNIFDLQFCPGRMQIINSAGALLFTFNLQGNGAALPWTAGNLKNVVYAVLGLSVYVTFAGMRPQVITWDGVATWTIADYVELLTVGGQKRTTFYRLSPQNITAQPSAISGAITVQFSSPIVVAGMVGTRIRYAGRQILLGSVIDASNMNATVMESLPVAQVLGVSGGVGNLSIGDVLIGGTSGAKGIVTTAPTAQVVNTILNAVVMNVGDAVTGGTSGATGIITSVLNFGQQLIVSLNTGTAFIAAENIIGPAGARSTFSVSPVSLVVQLLQNPNSANAFAVSEKIASTSFSAAVSTIATTTPGAISVWDDEVINAFRGYPASCFVDQFRVGFCNFPALPGGIAWSAINSPTDLYVGTTPSDAIFEIAPRKVQIYYVVPGPEGSEFVFTDRGVYYIPISETNPLKPGSVAFKLLSGDGAAQVQPRVSQEVILYVNAGQTGVMAIIASGAFLRPFNTKNLADYHNHLFNNIQAIAAPSADSTFAERYAYVLNGDGSIVIGKYSPDSLQTNLPVIGWGPWSGTGVVSWISAHQSDVLFTSSYFGTGIVEALDDAQYLDCALNINALPATFAAPLGKGPLWFIPNQSVTLIDQVTRAMGTYQIDANGFIVPQGNGGEDLTIASLVAGQPWTMTIEPYAPIAQPGSDVGQRINKRQFSNFAVYVINSTGFLLAKLFDTDQTRTSPALGTIMSQHRVPTWNQDDDATKPPTQRWTAESFRPSGSSFNPRVAIIKDTPGPLMICEIAMEITT